MSDPAPPTASPTRRHIHTERRERPFRWGIGLAILGLALVIGGGVVLTATQAAQILGAADRAEVPDILSFEAEARSYAVVLIRDPAAFGVPGDPATNLACDVAFSDGTTARVDGSRPGTALETDVGESIGTFDAVEGPTTVACAFGNSANSRLYFVAVAPERRGLSLAGGGLIGSGLALVAVSIVLIVIGVRGRMVVVPAQS